jgi:hypothetical protein
MIPDGCIATLCSEKIRLLPLRSLHNTDPGIRSQSHTSPAMTMPDPFSNIFFVYDRAPSIKYFHHNLGIDSLGTVLIWYRVSHNDTVARSFQQPISVLRYHRYLAQKGRKKTTLTMRSLSDYVADMPKSPLHQGSRHLSHHLIVNMPQASSHPAHTPMRFTIFVVLRLFGTGSRCQCHGHSRFVSFRFASASHNRGPCDPLISQGRS